MSLPVTVLVILGSCGPTIGAQDVDRVPVSDTGDAPLEEVSAGLAGLAEAGAHNVIVVHVDTLRADHLLAYGGARDTLPRISSRSWLVVEPLRSLSSWTIPSTITLLTALEPRNHGVTHMTTEGLPNAPMTHPTAATHFKDAGYATYVVSGNMALEQVEGMFADFDDVASHDVEGYEPYLDWQVDASLAWIDGLPAGTSFYAHLQPMNVHAPYRPDDAYLGTWSDPDALPFDIDAYEDEQLAQFQASYYAATDDAERARVIEQLNAVYDEDILGIDEQLERLIAALEARGLDRDTLVVLSGDHGETLTEDLAERSEIFYGHGWKVRPELVTIPFMIYHPAFPPDNRVTCLGQNTDVLPTLLRAVGLADMDGVDGVALQDGCRAFTHCSVFRPNAEGDLAEVAVADSAGFLRRDCASGLSWRYDLVADPTGLLSVDAADFEPDARLTAELETYVAAIQESYGPLRCDVAD